MDISTIIMLAVLVFLIGLMVLGTLRRKKFNEKLTNMRLNLKVGDKVMTDTGVVGEIVNKRSQDEYTFLTLKTGSNDNYGYTEVHENAIYYVFDADNTPNYAGQNQDEDVDSTTDTTADK